MNKPVNTTPMPKALGEELVRYMSKQKNEPEWMLEKRLASLELYNKTAIPSWGPDLSK
mgnify:CR=1 FL=1